MSIGYATLGYYDSNLYAEIENAAVERVSRIIKEDAAKKAANEEMIAAIKSGVNGGACPLLAKQYNYSAWLPVESNHYGKPLGCGLTDRQLDANAAAAWVVENVNGPCYHNAEEWFDVVARVAAGETRGMAGGKNSPKSRAVLALDEYRANSATEKPTEVVAEAVVAEAVVDGLGSEVKIPSGMYEGFVGVLVAARKARVTVFGRDYIAEW